MARAYRPSKVSRATPAAARCVGAHCLPTARSPSTLTTPRKSDSLRRWCAASAAPCEWSSIWTRTFRNECYAAASAVMTETPTAYSVETLADAYRLLAEHGSRGRVIAGGTDLMVLM